jgi:hypothetical protein
MPVVATIRWMRWQRAVVTVSLALVVVSVVAAWIAIGQLAESTDRALERTELSLEAAKEIAVETTAAVDQFREALTPVGDGLTSTSKALASTRDVSASVREALGGIRFLDNVQDVRERLETTEVTLLLLETDLANAKGELVQTQLVLNLTVNTLGTIPGELDASIAEVRDSRGRLDRQVLLWRLAALGTGLAVFGGLLVIGSLATAHGRGWPGDDYDDDANADGDPAWPPPAATTIG